jgi:hypothetical protein
MKDQPHPVKQQKPARRAKPVTRTVKPSTKKKGQPVTEKAVSGLRIWPWATEDHPTVDRSMLTRMFRGL